MFISIKLDAEQTARLEERVRQLGVDAAELAKAAVNDLLARAAEDFDRAAKQVLEKNLSSTGGWADAMRQSAKWTLLMAS